MRLAHDGTDSHALATGEATEKSQNFLRVRAGDCRARVHSQVGLRPRHLGGKKAALPFSPDSRAAPTGRTSADQRVVGDSETGGGRRTPTVPREPGLGPPHGWAWPAVMADSSPPAQGAQRRGLQGWRFRSTSQWVCRVRTMGSLWAKLGGVPGQTGRLPAKVVVGGDQQATGKKKAGTLALSWGLAWGGRNSQSCPGLGVGEPPPAPCLRSASPRGQWVRAAAARAASGWSAGGPQAGPWGGPRLPRPNSPVMAQEETAPTFPSPALPLPSPDPSAEIWRLPPAPQAHTAQ